jgi:hypothetical protein
MEVGLGSYSFSSCRSWDCTIIEYPSRNLTIIDINNGDDLTDREIDEIIFGRDNSLSLSMQVALRGLSSIRRVEAIKSIGIAGFQQTDISQVLRDLCRGLRSFAELKSAAKDFIPLLERKADSKLLRGIVPMSIRLQNGLQTKIQDERGRPPWVASRLQDFFGMRDTPRVGADYTCLRRTSGLCRLRPTLSDSGRRLYPQVRRELMRRYLDIHGQSISKLI